MTTAQATFRYDPQAHEYWLGDLRLPSVTQVLRCIGVIDAEHYTEVARQRGRAVHIATALLDQGRLNWDSLAATEEWLKEPITGYVKAWERFRRETGFTPRLIERSTWHPTYLYGGTPDRTGTFQRGQVVVLDIKTGPVQDWAGLQLAGYLEALTAHGDADRRHRRVAVQLKPDGDYAPPRFFDDQDEGLTFLGALGEFRWRQKHGYIV